MRIEVSPESITATGAEVVVNASNERAVLGSGVSGALRGACGPRLQKEMDEALRARGGILAPDDCLVTSAGDATAFRHVLHVAAVDFRTDPITSLDRVRHCTRAAMQAAHRLADREGKALSIAFPLLGTGVGGLDREEVFAAMLEELGNFACALGTPPIERVIFAIPDQKLQAQLARLLSAD